MSETRRRVAGLDWFESRVEGARGTLFHIHGGAFRAGGPERLVPFCSALAAKVGCTVVASEYPLAPENPFPCALHALAEGLKTLDGDEPLVISGDSAGGNLAAGLCLIGAEADALMLMSPWLDLRLTSPGYERAAATDQLFSRTAAADAAALYLQGYHPEHPLASPLLADVAGLPPTFILTGGPEVLLDDSLDFAARLARAKVDVELRVVPDMQHVAPTFSSEWPGSSEGMDAIVRFLRRQLH